MEFKYDGPTKEEQENIDRFHKWNNEMIAQVHNQWGEAFFKTFVYPLMNENYLLKIELLRHLHIDKNSQRDILDRIEKEAKTHEVDYASICKWYNGACPKQETDR